MMKKLFILLLAALLLSSCGQAATEEPAADTAAAENAPIAEETEPETEDPYIDTVEAEDFGGRPFNLLLRDEGSEVSWSIFDAVAEEATGEAINDAIYNRNLSINEKYNVEILGEMNKNSLVTLNNCVKAGDSTYDAAFLNTYDSSSAAQAGSLMDYGMLEAIDMTKPYWDQRCISDLSIAGKTYFLTGDISSIDKKATWILMFNKNLINSFDLESPYDLVNEGTWTVDKFKEMSADVSSDLNGDGEWTVEDQYGLATTPDTVHGLFYSCGGQYIRKDENDLPVFDMDIELCTSILETAGQILSNPQNTLLSTNIKGSANAILDLRDCFIEGRSLFYGEVMFHVAGLREMADDFGIIPMPKLNEAQEDYITYTNPAGPMLVVPMTTADLTCTGKVLESLASASHYTLTPAYYDIALKGKYARDEDSAAMLDIIFAHRVYDLTQAYGWGSMPSSFKDLAVKGSTDLASLVASKQSIFDSGIEKFVSAFTD
ncbi:MAG: hypothetical protein IKY52_07205 [Clostridia bacterium]|nr:hypothetical protein [Clostridia bacterium]